MRFRFPIQRLRLLRRRTRQRRCAEEIPRQQLADQIQKPEYQYRNEAQYQCEQKKMAHRLFSPQSVVPDAVTAGGNGLNRLLPRWSAMQGKHRARVQKQQYRDDGAAGQRQHFGIEAAADILHSSRDSAGARFDKIHHFSLLRFPLAYPSALSCRGSCLNNICLGNNAPQKKHSTIGEHPFHSYWRASVSMSSPLPEPASW